MAKKWSKEARERYSKMMKEKYGGRKEPEPSIRRNNKAEGILEEEDMSSSDKYISKKFFTYDEGQKFEQGQIVELFGLPNDEKLVKLGYIVPWQGRSDLESTCIKCGKVFGSSSGYQAHCASHYSVCTICNKEVPPETWDKHQEAHAVLA